MKTFGRILGKVGNLLLYLLLIALYAVSKGTGFLLIKLSELTLNIINKRQLR